MPLYEANSFTLKTTISTYLHTLLPRYSTAHRARRLPACALRGALLLASGRTQPLNFTNSAVRSSLPLLPVLFWPVHLEDPFQEVRVPVKNKACDGQLHSPRHYEAGPSPLQKPLKGKEDQMQGAEPVTLRRNRGKPGFDTGLLKTVPKAQATTDKTDKPDLIKI